MERRFIIEGLAINPPIADNFCLVKDFAEIEKLGDNDKEYQLKITGNGNRTEEQFRQEGSIVLASRIITSFRLQQPGGIGYNREVKNNHSEVIEESGLPYRQPRENLLDPYEIAGAILADIKTKVGQIEGIIEREKNNHETLFRCALAWFNRSYNEENMENILVDLIICLEILFVRSEEGKYKNQRIKARTGTFIEADLLKRKKLQSDLLLAYKIRNCVAHEGNVYRIVFGRQKDTTETRSDWEFLMCIRDYARRSLKEYVHRLIDFKANVNKTPKTLKNTIWPPRRPSPKIVKLVKPPKPKC